MGLYMVKITLIFNFMTRGVGDKDGEGIGSWIYKSVLIIGNAGNLETDEPIICVFFAVYINKLGFNIRD